ncbi:MAG: glycosyltransferase family 2 protein [Caldilineaceae bacterium]|nr:glycosyltransferase family 2 protein [Caldilineaceae bacterium]HRJ43132.1 glycosyltransferase family 2 protein [Caldilineaceae bacterium]
MHLIIQIPCYNEAETLPLVLAELPRSLPGITRLEVLVIDDGSSDGTVQVAEALGVTHIVRHPRNRGLATAFQTGLEYALRAGADVVVNTDGDNQYPGHYIEELIGPVLRGEADIVIGDRQTGQVAHFSLVKRLLQRAGSWVVRVASGTDVPDATSGFRAFSREATLRLIVLTQYTYTLETIIQARRKGLAVTSVPITVHNPTRQSRLVRSNWNYVKRSAATIVRLYTFYEPLRTFSLLAAPFVVGGLILLARFFYFYLFTVQTGVGRLAQSVTIGGTLFTVGFLIFLFGVLADISSTQRALMEEILYRQRKLDPSTGSVDRAASVSNCQEIT